MSNGDPVPLASNPRTDLPLSLRTWCDPAVGARLSNRAADEIERLTRERDEAQKLAQFECKARFDYYAYSDRLYVELGGIVHMLGNEEDIESAIQNLEAIMERLHGEFTPIKRIA